MGSRSANELLQSPGKAFACVIIRDQESRLVASMGFYTKASISELWISSHFSVSTFVKMHAAVTIWRKQLICSYCSCADRATIMVRLMRHIAIRLGECDNKAWRHLNTGLMHEFRDDVHVQLNLGCLAAVIRASASDSPEGFVYPKGFVSSVTRHIGDCKFSAAEFKRMVEELRE